MLKRTLTGIVMALVALPCLIFSHTWIFPILSAFLCVVGTLEMLGCIGAKKFYTVTVPLSAAAIGFPLLARYMENRNEFLAVYITILFVILVYLMALPVFAPEKVTTQLVSSAFVTSVFIITAFSSIVLLRDMEGGIYYFMIPVVAPFTCDIFAYFTGRLFGRHKLIPKISPNKTVEGSIGGTFFCTVICTVYGILLKNVFSLSALLPVWTFAVGGILISLVSQLGDLTASSIKRQHGIKDYGKIFPGHGGVMDRFDSVTPTVPLFLMLMVLFAETVL